jgi:peptide deformylase
MMRAMILRIVTYPDPILHKKAKPVERVTPDIARLMDDMTQTMYADSGVGLAAPQVGASLRVIVIDVGLELPTGTKKSNLVQLANPEILSASGRVEWEEGCLSVPEFRLKVKRHAKIAVKGLDRHNRPVEMLAEGLFAVAFQHEIDHLDGKLLIDRVGKREQDKYLKMKKNLALC